MINKIKTNLSDMSLQSCNDLYKKLKIEIFFL